MSGTIDQACVHVIEQLSRIERIIKLNFSDIYLGFHSTFSIEYFNDYHCKSITTGKISYLCRMDWKIFFKNSRTYLSSTSVPLEVDAVSVHDDTQSDSWVSGHNVINSRVFSFFILVGRFSIENLEQYCLR